VTVTAYTRRCPWCQRTYRTAHVERTHCSPGCQQRHRWFGAVPDTRRDVDRYADHDTGPGAA
jgi:hypothetical protein